MHQTTKKIAIGLGTFKRPQMVEQTLKSLTSLIIPDGYETTLIVADNDEQGSAEAIVKNNELDFNFPVTYVVVKERGIVHMRNRILEMANELAVDLMAFLDDDEEVENNWLHVMLKNKTKFNAHVVVGRVARILPEKTPRWIISGRFFERPNVPTGSVRDAASTSNVIFDFNLIYHEMKLRFHPALNLAGSSDTYLFTEANNRGAKIIWVNEDLVKEYIPETRMTVNWLLQRAFRHTNSRTLRSRLRNSYLKTLFLEGGYGLVHFLFGILSIPIYIFWGKAGLVHILRFFVKGVGSFAGLGGFVFQEYKKTHGY